MLNCNFRWSVTPAEQHYIWLQIAKQKADRVRRLFESFPAAPPDVRVVIEQQEPNTAPSRAMALDFPNGRKDTSKLEISKLNTTLIGDYTLVALMSDSKWLIQAQGNATFTSTVALVKDGMLIIDRRYVFFQLGGNQVRTSDKSKLYGQMLELVVAVREVSPDSRIYFLGVLPRVPDNQDIKPFIMRFNRWLAANTADLDMVFEKIKFLPIHLKFINGIFLRQEMFQSDFPLLPSNIGATLFRQRVFNLAGFVKNV